MTGTKHDDRPAHRWVTIQGVRWHMRLAGIYADGASLPPIVLVHGYAVSSAYMIPLARQLARHNPVYAPDLPGHGLSADAAHPRVTQVSDYADDLAAWLDAMALDGAVLIGHSFGCQIVAELCARSRQHHPIRAAVFISPTVDPASRPWLRQAGYLARDILQEPVSLNILQTIDYLRFGPRQSIQASIAMMRDHIECKVPQIQVPLLVLRGTHDRVVSEAWAECVARLAPAGQVATVHGAAHGVHYRQPAQVARLIHQFIRDATER